MRLRTIGHEFEYFRISAKSPLFILSNPAKRGKNPHLRNKNKNENKPMEDRHSPLSSKTHVSDCPNFPSAGNVEIGRSRKKVTESVYDAQRCDFPHSTRCSRISMLYCIICCAPHAHETKFFSASASNIFNVTLRVIIGIHISRAFDASHAQHFPLSFSRLNHSV